MSVRYLHVMFLHVGGDSLAAGALGTEGDDVEAGGGLVGETGLLGGDDDAALSSGLDADGLGSCVSIP
jgi:hypothetical protein